ncbi:MAG TPA: sensor histidine kinase [Longimicrobium sp.]|jgi:two-component system sensor histidine kinase DesK
MPAAAPPRVRRFRLLPPDAPHGWLAYVWPAYLAPLFIQPAQSGRAWQWAALLAVLPLFLWSYFRAFWLSGRRVLPHIVLQSALAVAFAPWNSAGSTFFIYAASFAPRAGDRRRAIRIIAAIVVAAAPTALLSERPFWFWIYAAVFSAFVGAVNLQTAEAARANARLRLAQDEVRHLAAVAERERIARDLHDVLGHTLSLIVLKAELASRLAGRDPERAAAEIRDVERVSRKALAEVREAIRGYHATLEDEVARAGSLLRAAGIHAGLAVQLPPLDRAREEAVALALREAVTNVVRHSGATTCTVRLAASDAGCTLAVEDDGRGGITAEGQGLRGMRERVEALGGTVRWTCRRGTTLTVTLPWGESGEPAPFLASVTLAPESGG